MKIQVTELTEQKVPCDSCQGRAAIKIKAGNAEIILCHPCVLVVQAMLKVFQKESR